MNVGELISLLKNYHDNTLVLVDGYEGDYDPFGMKLVRVVPNEVRKWYYGEFEENETSGHEVLVLYRTKSKVDV